MFDQQRLEGKINKQKIIFLYYYKAPEYMLFSNKANLNSFLPILVAEMSTICYSSFISKRRDGRGNMAGLGFYLNTTLPKESSYLIDDLCRKPIQM